MNQVENHNKERNILIDIIKGISIILVVLGHTYNTILHNFIYLFHVAVFYILSGYCFMPCYSDSTKGLLDVTKKRFLTLWVPYVAYNFVFLLLQNLFLKIGLLTSNNEYFLYSPYLTDGFVSEITIVIGIKSFIKSFFFMNSRPFCGGLWFLGGLFYVTIFYTIFDYLLKKLKLDNFHLLFSILFLFIGYFLVYFDIIAKIPLTKQITLILITEFLFSFGFFLRKYQVFSYKLKRFYSILGLLLSGIVLFFMTKLGSISIGAVKIVNPLFFIIVSVIGCFFVYCLSSLISFQTIMTKIMCQIGKHTLVILALHTLFFKFVSFIQFAFYNGEKIVLALFPVWKNGLLWSLLYTLFGVFGPLLVAFVFKKKQDYDYYF